MAKTNNSNQTLQVRLTILLSPECDINDITEVQTHLQDLGCVTFISDLKTINQDVIGNVCKLAGGLNTTVVTPDDNQDEEGNGADSDD